MAIIYSYPKVTTPLATDVLVLTDTTLTAGKRKNKTKSLAMSDLAAYVVSSTSGITGGGTFNTIPLWTPDGFKLGDSIITQAASGQGVTVTGKLDVTGFLTVEEVATFNEAAQFFNPVNFEDAVSFQGTILDQSGSAGTAGQVLSSTGTETEWVDVSGTVTGTGTTNTLPIWTDGPGGVLGDSPISSTSSTTTISEKLSVESLISQEKLGFSTYIGLETGISDGSYPTGTAGNYNLGVGYKVLNNYSIGDLGGVATPGENVGLGSGSLQQLTTGTNNIGIGAFAGTGLTTGRNNIAIGKNSLINPTGLTNSNIAIGFSALNSTILALPIGNVAIGNTAGQDLNNTTLDNNVFIGSNAAKTFAGTLSKTVIIGTSAGTSLGGNGFLGSVLIGPEAGAGLASPATAPYDIGIGSKALFNFSSSGSNIAIGTSAQATNTDTGVTGSILIDSNGSSTAASNAICIATGGTGNKNESNASLGTVIGGSLNVNNGVSGGIFGGNTNITSGLRGVILGGNSNEIDGAADNSATIGGTGLLVTGNNQLAIGSFNFPRNNIKFVVGDGTGNGDKSNSFEIYNNGKVRILSNNLEIGDKSNQIPSTPLNITGLKNTSVITLASTTNDSNWVQGDKIGGIDFYSADGSGSGPGVFGSINYITTTNSTSGGITGMTFNVADSTTKNVERMRICDTGRVGIGTISPASKLTVDGGDVEVEDASAGLILNSPDGTRYRVTVANGGTLTVSAV